MGVGAMVIAGLSLVMLNACRQSETLVIEITGRVDFDAVLEGVLEPGADVIDIPGGVRIPIALSQEVDLVQTNRSAIGLVLDGGEIDVGAMRYSIDSNTATVNLPRLNLLADDVHATDPAAAFPIAVMPGVQAETTQVFGVPMWLTVGEERLKIYIRETRFRAYLVGHLDLDEGDEVPSGAIDVRLRIDVTVSER